VNLAQVHQLGWDLVVDGVVKRDGRRDLALVQGPEAQVGIEPGVEHGLAAEHFVAAGSAHEQQGEDGARVVVEMAEVLEALPVEPLGFVDHDQPWALRKRRLQGPVGVERPDHELAEAQALVEDRP
jgi:hypothetical protein